MNNIAIKVENLSKVYRLGEIGTGSIGQDVDRWFKTKVLGKEDPFLKIGETNNRSKKGISDVVYSLSDINFEFEQGDTVGIIGRNGAGKSTLLKILSRVTTPTTGGIKIKGRVASLLEVGTGFHPELTGRENIYLNGAILGMRNREIKSKIDEIIEFSGVERYIDTPVKRYSSGMYVRLAFAVAAHLESEILIVDEVLAVGDDEFQKKAIAKMRLVSESEGRTILVVSHNMESISKLCAKSMLLENGTLLDIGDTSSIINRYLHANVGSKDINHYRGDWDPNLGKKIKFNEIIGLGSIKTNENLYITLEVENLSNESQKDLYFSFGLTDKNKRTVFNSYTSFAVDLKPKSKEKFSLMINTKNLLMPGEYFYAAAILNARLPQFSIQFDGILGYPSLKVFGSEDSDLDRWDQDNWSSICLENQLIKTI
jgi:lipopolysaccharide transport system ATP-binding protein